MRVNVTDEKLVLLLSVMREVRNVGKKSGGILRPKIKRRTMTKRGQVVDTSEVVGLGIHIVDYDHRYTRTCSTDRAVYVFPPSWYRRRFTRRGVCPFRNLQCPRPLLD